WQGTTYVFPALTDPPALAGYDNARMEREKGPGDWVLRPLVPYGASEPNGSAVLVPPLTAGHPFGTDALGRDVFARTVHGARTAFSLGLGTSAILVVLGIALGALAGFRGGFVDAIVT